MKPETNSNRHFLSLALGRLARACLRQHAWRALDQQERPKFRMTFLRAHLFETQSSQKTYCRQMAQTRLPATTLSSPSLLLPRAEWERRLPIPARARSQISADFTGRTVVAVLSTFDIRVEPQKRTS